MLVTLKGFPVIQDRAGDSLPATEPALSGSGVPVSPTLSLGPGCLFQHDLSTVWKIDMGHVLLLEVQKRAAEKNWLQRINWLLVGGAGKELWEFRTARAQI